MGAEDWREPYVGEGADGARRSAQIDREEADTLDRRSELLLVLLDSANRWDRQAEEMEAKAGSYVVVHALIGPEAGAAGSPVASRADALSQFVREVNEYRDKILAGRRRIVVIDADRFHHLIGTREIHSVFRAEGS
jgi:hypothetical protein